MVGSMPKQQVGNAATPAVLQQPATTRSVPAPDPSQQAYWESRVSQSRVDAMEALRELRDVCFNTPMKPEQVGSKVEDSLGSDLDQFTMYQSTIHGMLSSGTCQGKPCKQHSTHVLPVTFWLDVLLLPTGPRTYLQPVHRA
eukprot:361100-Chlamydomonas_euryale.AAC.14